MMFSHPGFSCVVAEADGRIVGSNCLDERSVIAGIGPITIDPGIQNLGIGRMLMRAVLDRANQGKAVGVRLVQAAYHNRSLSLYSRLGFDIREPLSCLQGRTLERSIPGCLVRPAEPTDLDACNVLARQVQDLIAEPSWRKRCNTKLQLPKSAAAELRDTQLPSLSPVMPQPRRTLTFRRSLPPRSLSAVQEFSCPRGIMGCCADASRTVSTLFPDDLDEHGAV